MDSTWDANARDRALAYLDNAFCLAVISRSSFPCVFEGVECLTDEGESLSFCVMTDGVWTWDSNLSHCIRQHRIRIPDDMIAHMTARDFIPLAIIEPPDGDWMAYCHTLPHPPLLHAQDRTTHILHPRPPKPNVSIIREAAASAFRARNFSEAAALYASIKREHSLAEQRKMEYARERSILAQR